MHVTTRIALAVALSYIIAYIGVHEYDAKHFSPYEPTLYSAVQSF